MVCRTDSHADPTQVHVIQGYFTCGVIIYRTSSHLVTWYPGLIPTWEQQIQDWFPWEACYSRLLCGCKQLKQCINAYRVLLVASVFWVLHAKRLALCGICSGGHTVISVMSRLSIVLIHLVACEGWATAPWHKPVPPPKRSLRKSFPQLESKDGV